MSGSKTNQVTGERGSTVERIETALLDDIAAGILAPGERLDEVTLTNRFGVSRTPVREALTRMTAQGVLVPGEKRGVRVANYSRAQLAQLFEAMHEIEVACARIASQRLSLLSRSEITSAQAECIEAAEANDKSRYLHANEQFHKAIYRSTGNPYMAEVASEFRHRTGPFRAKRFQTKDDLIASANSHIHLMEQLFSENSKTASEGMSAHMTASFLAALTRN